MRLFVSVLATAAMFFVASTASAVEFNLTSPSEVNVLAPGEEFTIEITITNSGNLPIDGLGASVYGYTDGTAEFVSGSAVSSFLNVFEVAPGVFFGGLTNLAGEDAGDGTRTLGETTFGTNPNRVQIALAGVASTVNGASGAADRGLDGQAGTAQFSVTFSALASGSIFVGTSFPGDGLSTGGNSVQGPDLEIVLTVVPEPGTALLMGLGLAGLAAAGRRE